MKQAVIAALLVFLGLSAVHAQHLTAATDKTFNLITDSGATCNGVADDGPAFFTTAGNAMRAYQTTNPGAPVTLFIPPGSTCLFKTCPGAFPNLPFANVQNVTIIAIGATITAPPSANCGGSFTLGFMPTWAGDAFTANSAGDACLTMTTPGTETNYPVGRWVTVAGQAMQVNSFPPNYANWEFAQVASIPTGKVCFTKPLAHAYPTTGVIDLSAANCSNVYCGGPGKLILMNAGFGGYFHFLGGTWDLGAPVETSGQTVIFDNVTWNNSGGLEACWLPSVIGTVVFNNSSWPTCFIEVDKEIDQIILNNSNIRRLTFQSASVNTLTLNTGSSTGAFGTPLHTICNNSTLTTLTIGNSFGSLPDTFVGNNCNITADISSPAFSNAMFMNCGASCGFVYNGSGQFESTGNVNVFAGNPDYPTFISNGGRLHMSADAQPDNNNDLTITGSSLLVPGSSNTRLFIQTTLPGATLPPPNDTTIGGWIVDPEHDFACSGCFGSRIAFDLNFAAAQHQPLWTYHNRTYTCANNLANVPGSYDINVVDGFTSVGAWQTATINVITADTNPADAGGSQLTVGAGQIFNKATGAHTFTNTSPGTVDLRATGTRTISPTTVTGSQGADNLTAPPYGASTWMAGNINSSGTTPFAITNGPAAQCPVVNVIFQTSR